MATFFKRLCLTLLLGAGGIAISFPFVRHSIQASESYAFICNALLTSPAVAQRVGTVREVRLPWFASERLNGREATLTMDVTGDRGTARARVNVVKVAASGWEIRGASLDGQFVRLR